MPWIESHTVLLRHRKLREFARELRLAPVYAMGHLHSLWHVALEQQEDGDLSSWSDELIAESAAFSGDAPQFVRLLQKHRWLDAKILHDWLDYAGQYLRRKYAKDNRRRLVEIWLKHGRKYGAAVEPTESQPTPNTTNQPTNQPLPTNPPAGEGSAEDGLKCDGGFVASGAVPTDEDLLRFVQSHSRIPTWGSRTKMLEGMRKLVLNFGWNEATKLIDEVCVDQSVKDPIAVALTRLESGRAKPKPKHTKSTDWEKKNYCPG